MSSRRFQHQAHLQAMSKILGNCFSKKEQQIDLSFCSISFIILPEYFAVRIFSKKKHNLAENSRIIFLCSILLIYESQFQFLNSKNSCFRCYVSVNNKRVNNDGIIYFYLSAQWFFRSFISAENSRIAIRINISKELDWKKNMDRKTKYGEQNRKNFKRETISKYCIRITRPKNHKSWKWRIVKVYYWSVYNFHARTHMRCFTSFKIHLFWGSKQPLEK